MGNRLMKYLSFVLLVGGMSWLTTVGVAQADDLKVYPGSSCHTKSSYTQMAQGSYSAKGVSNPSSDKPLKIYCPLIRDYMADDAGISKIEVWYHNPNRQRVISCQVFTTLKHGRPLHSKRSFSGKGVIDGSFTLAYGKDAGVWSSYTMTCNLPNSPTNRDLVTIHAFKIREYD